MNPSRRLVVMGLCLGLSVGLGAAEAVREGAPGTGGSGMVASVDPKVLETLRPALRLLSGARTVTASLGMVLRMEMQGMKQEMPAEYTLAIEQPNRIALVLKSGIAGATLVSDGTNLHTYVPLLKQYVQQPAPTNLAGLSQAGGPGVRGEMGGMFLQDLFHPDAEARVLSGVTNAGYVARTNVGGVACHQLRFHQAQFAWDLWVDAGPTPLIRRLAADMGGFMRQSMQAQMKDNPMAEMFQAMAMSLELEFKDWVLNEPVSAERFVFVPPEGAVKVDDLMSGMVEEGEEEPETEHPLVGKAAPSLQLKLLDGTLLDLEMLKGAKVVVLDFWATWCGPCVKALPVLAEVTAGFRERGVVFYAINVQEDAETIRGFLGKRGLKVAVALDPDGKAGERFGVEGIPMTVILDRQGVVRQVHVGLLPDLKERLTRELEALVSGAAPKAPVP